MSRSRPYPYGTVLRVTEAFLLGQPGRNLSDHMSRRFMVLSDTGEPDGYAIAATPVAGTYDEKDEIHYPAPKFWEPVDA